MSQNGKQITIGLWKLVFLMDKTADQILQKRLGLKFSQLRMLMAIKRHAQNCPCSQKDIARFWQLTEGAVSRQIELLKKGGLVTTRENAENRRANMLTLTSKGEERLKRGIALLDAHYDKIYKVANPVEQKTLVKVLEKLIITACQEQAIKT